MYNVFCGECCHACTVLNCACGMARNLVSNFVTWSIITSIIHVHVTVYWHFCGMQVYMYVSYFSNSIGIWLQTAFPPNYIHRQIHHNNRALWYVQCLVHVHHCNICSVNCVIGSDTD